MKRVLKKRDAGGGDALAKFGKGKLSIQQRKKWMLDLFELQARADDQATLETEWKHVAGVAAIWSKISELIDVHLAGKVPTEQQLAAIQSMYDRLGEDMRARIEAGQDASPFLNIPANALFGSPDAVKKWAARLAAIAAKVTGPDGESLVGGWEHVRQAAAVLRELVELADFIARGGTPRQAQLARIQKAFDALPASMRDRIERGGTAMPWIVVGERALAAPVEIVVHKEAGLEEIRAALATASELLAGRWVEIVGREERE